MFYSYINNEPRSLQLIKIPVKNLLQVLFCSYGCGDENFIFNARSWNREGADRTEEFLPRGRRHRKRTSRNRALQTDKLPVSRLSC